MAMTREFTPGHVVRCDVCGRILGEGIHTYEARKAALIAGDEYDGNRWICKYHDRTNDDLEPQEIVAMNTIDEKTDGANVDRVSRNTKGAGGEILPAPFLWVVSGHSYQVASLVLPC